MLKDANDNWISDHTQLDVMITCFYKALYFDDCLSNCYLLQGVLEAIRISCAGYPTRRTFYEFLNRFGVLAPEVLDGK